jgi:replication-associated recombination protein RarA
MTSFNIYLLAFLKHLVLARFDVHLVNHFPQTSLAHIIANGAKKSGSSRFVTLSAAASGINDVKEVIKVAKNEQQMFKRKTILFMDEIHRFNKSQQVHYFYAHYVW